MSKDDREKSPVRSGLLEYFPRSCMAVADLSVWGAEKYSWGNWKKVENGKRRYGDAGVRHICEAAIHGDIDKESKMNHAVHEAWNALARLEFILEEEES